MSVKVYIFMKALTMKKFSYTVNDRLNAPWGVYFKIKNFKGVFIRELIKRGVYFKMHKFRKQKRTFSGTCSNRTIAAKIGLVIPRSESGKMARVLCDKLQEMNDV